MKKKVDLLLEIKRQSKIDLKSINEHEEYFDNSNLSTISKLETFAKHVRRQRLSKFLAHFELFKKILKSPGSVIDLGINSGQSIFTFAKISSILEPYNYTRKIIGFDTFKGITKIHKKEKTKNMSTNLRKGGFAFSDYKNLKEGINIYDRNRFMSHIKKIEIVKGDILNTLPKYLKANPHLVISLLHVDLDAYIPTKFALKKLFKLMPKGSLIILDQINQEPYPGETIAVKETLGIENIKLCRFEWETGLSYFIK